MMALPEIGFVVLCNFTAKTAEGASGEQPVGRLLVSANLSQSHRAWPVAVWALDRWSGVDFLVDSLDDLVFALTLPLGHCLLRAGHIQVFCANMSAH